MVDFLQPTAEYCWQALREIGKPNLVDVRRLAEEV
jgi:hypothetical protein